MFGVQQLDEGLYLLLDGTRPMTGDLALNTKLSLVATSDANTGLIEQAGNPLLHTYGTQSVYVGDAGNFTETGAGRNVGIGADVLGVQTTGRDNVGIGPGALSSLTTSVANVAIGTDAMQLHQAGGSNVAIGTRALQNAINNVTNFALGYQALQNAISNGNCGLGYRALENSTSAGLQTAVGGTAGFSNTSTSGSRLTCVGYQSAYFNTRAGDVVAIGYRAGYGVTATFNARGTFVGSESFAGITSGNNNIGLGYRSGDNVTTGSNNIMIGYDIDAQSATGSNQLSLGNLLFGTGVNGTGTAVSTGSLGVAITAPTARLHLPAGAAAAGGAPLKFTSGTNLTTPSAGAMEFNGTNLFFTPAATRRRVSLLSVTAPTVTGSRGGNAALASLLTQLAAEGIITDGTTA